LVFADYLSCVQVYFEDFPVRCPNIPPSFLGAERSHPFFQVQLDDRSILDIRNRLGNDSAIGSNKHEINLPSIRNSLHSNKTVLKVNNIAVKWEGKLSDQFILIEDNKLGVKCDGDIDLVRLEIISETYGLNRFGGDI
jgi:hypothetical protein